MRLRVLKGLFLAILVVLSTYIPASATDAGKTSNIAPVVSFFHPTGMNGFIVYDMDSGEEQGGLSYGNRSFDLSSPLGIPLTLEVEGFNLTERAYDFQQILQDGTSDYLQIFSIQHALTYGSKSSLSPFAGGPTDITMVVASANYQATDRFSAKLATTFSKTAQNPSDSALSVGYELDIAGLYQIAPGLTFSVGAGYATNLDSFKTPVQDQGTKGLWSLTSKLRFKF